MPKPFMPNRASQPSVKLIELATSGADSHCGA
jgi:hypothetical protein